MRVYILSAYPGPPADLNNFGFLWLRESAKDDPFGVHKLVDDPEQADIILFVENHAHDDPYSLSVRHHPVYRRFHDRCFVYHDDDYAVAVLRGIYPSILRRDYLEDRCRSAGYIARIAQNDAVRFDPTHQSRKWLYSFLGEENAPVRVALFAGKHPMGLVRNTSGERLWLMEPGPARELFTREYAEAIKDSQFVLCPRGYGPTTYRLFETMEMGRVPVILSDEWVPPPGPAWEEFSVRVPEASVGNIQSLLAEKSERHEEMGHRARCAWEQWFAKQVCFHRLVELCVAIEATPKRSLSTLRGWATLIRSPHLQNFLRPYHREIKRKVHLAFRGLET